MHLRWSAKRDLGGCCWWWARSGCWRWRSRNICLGYRLRAFIYYHTETGLGSNTIRNHIRSLLRLMSRSGWLFGGCCWFGMTRCGSAERWCQWPTLEPPWTFPVGSWHVSPSFADMPSANSLSFRLRNQTLRLLAWPVLFGWAKTYWYPWHPTSRFSYAPACTSQTPSVSHSSNAHPNSWWDRSTL